MKLLSLSYSYLKSIAKDLGLYPTLPTNAEIIEYVLADGTRRRLVRVSDALDVSVVTDDRIVGPIKCSNS